MEAPETIEVGDARCGRSLPRSRCPDHGSVASPSARSPVGPHRRVGDRRPDHTVRARRSEKAYRRIRQHRSSRGARPQGVLTYVVALLLVGVARLVDQASALRPEIDRLTNNGTQTSGAARRWDSPGPGRLTVLVVLVASWSSWSTIGVR